MRWGPRPRRWTGDEEDDLTIALNVVNRALAVGRAEAYQAAPRDYRVRRAAP